MGYSEVYCHICGISFNIGRIRRPDEPPTAAWSGLGGELGETYIDDGSGYRMCIGAGCLIARRTSDHRREWGAGEPPRWSDGEELGEDSSSDYVDPELEDSEPYEFDTPPESVAGEMDVDVDVDFDSDVEMRDDPAENEDDSNSEADYRRFILSLMPARPLSKAEPGERCPLVDEYNERPLRGVPQELMEHIAAPGCLQGGGYNGHNITAEEMQGSRTAQCLVPKPAGWLSEPGDEEFEATTDVFLSGLTDYMPSRDWSNPDVFPHRHGCDAPTADNSFFDENTASETAMPFHPACFEVFKRASLLRIGEVRIQDLMDWYRLEADYHQFNAFPRDPAAKRGSEQMWKHCFGDEFLAANPCFLPGLGPIIQGAGASDSEESDYHRGAFHIQASASPQLNLDDPFGRLPPELRFQFLSYLSPNDVGNLRLVSRTFRQLPQSFFHQLILRHMPWLWEAWCQLPYSFWATTSASLLREEDKKWQEEKQDIDRYIHILESEGRPYGENNAAVEVLKAKIATRELEMQKSRQSQPAPLLSKSPTDWRRLLVDITTRWDDLKGLRNRARIWKDCDEILDRIERHRANGRMGDGIVVDPSATCAKYFGLVRRQNQAWMNYIQAGRPGQYRWEDWANRGPQEVAEGDQA